MISAPDMPSISAWWIFVSAATLPIRQPVDHVQLPQRPRAVERAREDARHLLGELLVVAGRGQRQFAHVEIQVEVLVVHPVRVVEPQRDLDEPPAERREQRQPLLEQALHVAAVELPARRGRRVEDRDSADVPRLARRLERQELRVETGELSHLRSARRRYRRSLRPLFAIPFDASAT